MIATESEIATARALIDDAAEKPWFALTAVYGKLADISDLNATRITSDGENERFVAKRSMRAFKSLRTAMTDEHGAWFSATVIVQQDGSYEFAYNYTEPLEWDEGIDDESYVIDLARHPRPWGEIPEWHPVKRDYTEESWAAELDKGTQ